MERSEPTLVPEWLRSTGSVTGGGSSAHHFASSSQSDVPSPAQHSRNRNSRSISDFDSPRSAFLDRTASSNSRRISSNGSAKHAYSSFSRNHRDKDRDKERSGFADHWDRDSSDPLGSLTSRVEKNTLQRSHSMVSRKHGELVSRRVAVDSKDTAISNHSDGNGLLSGVSSSNSIQKVSFEKDFPSLGTEEKQGVPDIARVSSPGLSSAVQSLPVGSSALIGGEGWTSALAEVPSVVGPSSSGSLPALQTVSASGSGTPSGMAGLNMAEALAQAPPRARTAPQSSVKIQRLEELAIKQSRQLIPVTPPMPKGSVLNSSDKSKLKAVVRSGEMTVKSGQPQPSLLHHANQSHVGNIKSEMPKTSHGNFLVLKPAWENGVLSPTQKDVANLANNANSRAANNQLSAGPSVSSVPSRSSNTLKPSSVERKTTSLNLISGFSVEKKPSLAQTQSRNDFFNLLKKKTSTNTSAAPSDTGPDIGSSTMEKSEVTKEVGSASATPHAVENGGAATSNGDSYQETHRFLDDAEKNLSSIAPDEEEVAFLRSLGWEEDYGEGALTEEEINGFYQNYMKFRPNLKVCRGIQMVLESQATNSGEASTELSSSNSESEA